MHFKFNPFSQLVLNPAVTHLANINLTISTSQTRKVLSTILTTIPIQSLYFWGLFESQHIADFWYSINWYKHIHTTGEKQPMCQVCDKFFLHFLDVNTLLHI